LKLKIAIENLSLPKKMSSTSFDKYSNNSECKLLVSAPYVLHGLPDFISSYLKS
jgi:hypothetical protein